MTELLTELLPDPLTDVTDPVADPVADPVLNSVAGPGSPVDEAETAGPTAERDAAIPSVQEPERVFTFDSTHHAMWGEDVAREERIPAEVVPAPLSSGAKCALALRTTTTRFEALRRALDGEGVEYRVFP